MDDVANLPARIAGLSEAEAQARLKAEGYNELPRPDRRTPFRIVLEVVREPMLALLIAGGLVYLALGDWREALILLVFANLSIVITVIQETRTERVLEALRDLTSPRALVIRDGVRKRIAGREVARGDLVVLAEGDRVPADADPGRGRRPQNRRIAADGRIRSRCAKSQRGDVRRKRRRSPGGEDTAFGVLRFAGRARRRHRGSDRDRRREPDRQDRPVAGRTGNRAAPAANADEPTRAHFRAGRRRRHRRRGPALRTSCEDTGSRLCWAASRSACRCCRRNSRSS